jgi:hypothetical protein
MSEPTYHSSDFRTYPAENVKARDGKLVTMTLCEELVDGRWEAFYSVAR